jgi:hypothetical protein
MVTCATQAVLVISAMLLRYMAQQVSQDPSCNRDPVTFQWVRFLAFCITSLGALGVAFFDLSPWSLLIVFTIAGCMIGVDVTVLHWRPKPPPPNAVAPPVRFDIAARARARRP